MDWPFEGNLSFEYEVFIPIKNAFMYLADKNAVFELKTLYFHYTGFALESAEDADSWLHREPQRVYLDAMGTISDVDLRHFWQFYNGNEDSLITKTLCLSVGTINGEAASWNSFFNNLMNCTYCIDFDLDLDIHLNVSNVYIKQSDLDQLAEKFGIPIKNIWDENTFNNPLFDNKNNVEIDADSMIILENSIILFAKGVLIKLKFPNFSRT